MYSENPYEVKGLARKTKSRKSVALNPLSSKFYTYKNFSNIF